MRNVRRPPRGTPYGGPTHAQTTSLLRTILYVLCTCVCLHGRLFPLHILFPPNEATILVKLGNNDLVKSAAINAKPRQMFSAADSRNCKDLTAETAKKEAHF